MDKAIAVVGMSCRFPESNNIEEFWELLVNGKEAIREPPIWRWVGDEHLANDPNVRSQKAGFLKCPVDTFDAKFFGISPREAEMTDPQQRMLLEVTWESLEKAGINPTELRGTRTGVFSGVWKKDYEKLMMCYTPDRLLGLQEEFMGNSFSAISARIAYQLGLTGPNIATESGCASSMISLHLACQSLSAGETDLAIVGGVNLLLFPYTIESIKASLGMSPDGKCKAFDANADGYGRAEGCVSIVLKRYPDTIKSGDNVLALIRGSAVSQEGTSSGFGLPTKDCQAECMEVALNNAKISPSMISYIEAHGTGTITGDPIEISAISEVYSSERREPLWIGSVKANIGHTESCAGLTGLVKVILAMKHKTIPPHIYCNNVNPKIDLGAIPACLPKEAVEWKTYGDAPRIAGINSYGFTGANVHVIVQEPPTFNGVDQSALNGDYTETYQIVTISGRSEYSINELAIRYKQFLESQPNNFQNFCYTANVCRAKWNRRIAVIGKTPEEIVKGLDITNSEVKRVISPTAKVVFLFTAQDSQYLGMGENLYRSHPLFRHHFDECSKIVKKLTNSYLPDFIWSKNYGEQKDKSFYDPISIFCIEYCLWKLWENLGVIPDFILGHSMGEAAASVAAGIHRLEDAIYLLIERTKLFDELPYGQMLAIMAGIDIVNDLLRIFLKNNNSKWLDIAAINSSSQTIVSGRNETIKIFSQFCSEHSVKSTIMAPERAYHSRDMDLILPKLDKIVSNVCYGIPKYKYISSTTGEIVTDREVNKDYWIRNTRMPVNFKKAFELAVEQGGRVFVELGPQPVLMGIGNTIASKDISKDCLWIPSMRKSGDEWKIFLEGVGNLFVNGIDIDWKSFYSHFNYQKIAIPTYPFDHSRSYWYEKTIGSIPNVEKVNLAEDVTITEEKQESQSSQKTLLDEIQYKSPEQQLELIQTCIANIVSKILRLGDSDSINYSETFVDMGMDSLRAAEFRNYLQKVLGENVSINWSTILDCPSTEALSKYVLNTLLSTVSLDEDELDLNEIIKIDSKLCNDLVVEEIFKRPPSFQYILLTGVTGTLGPYMLQELILANPTITIVCIIRAKSGALTESRLRGTLLKNNISDCILKNCVILNGDIGDEYFKLSRDKYLELSEKVEAVVHLAVKNNHVESYKIRGGQLVDDIRTVNVVGTKNILQFAATKKNKFVFHASSIGAITKNTLAEELPADDNFGEGITMGYAVSKFISEKLIKQAMDEGIDCVVLRYPFIMGNSETGQFFFETDHLMLGLLTFLRLNKIPKSVLNNGIPFIPVEIAARVSVKMFNDSNASLGVYNFVGPDLWAIFPKVAKQFGYILEVVDDATVLKAVIEEGENSLMFNLKDIYNHENALDHMFGSSIFFTLEKSNEELKQCSKKFCKYAADSSIINFDGESFITAYFHYAKDNGILKKYCPIR